ncbi:transmembrane protein 44 isoform X2 [Heterodontus francisci]|uniref:transmembrane protein 44 isoform X2 n=1 Tax=Heterodontus francisci TaxID=7792 RepID=UPI00355B0E22
MRSAADSNQGRPEVVTRGSGVAAGSSSLWNWNYWINCFMQEKVCISFALWVLSLLFWVIAHIILFYLRCKRRVWREESLSCTIYAFLGNMCNMFGALLAKQLSIQVFTAAYMAAVDILHFLLILFPVCGSRSRSKSDQPRRRNKRRSSTMFMVCLPFAMSTSYYFWASPIAQVDFHGPRRKLLTTLLQDSTEIIGYTLGVIAVFIGWTSKFPLILKATRGKIDCSLQKWALLLSILGSVLYAAAVLAHEQTPEFILKALPWLLLFLGGAAVDLSILFLLCLLKNKTTRQNWGFEVVIESDTISLLESPGQDVEAEVQAETQSSDWVPLNIPQNNRYLRKMAEIGHYMDLSIEPVQEIGFGLKRLPGDGQNCTEREKRVDTLFVHDPPMYPPKQVIHANVSSGSSSDATSINSELEQKYLEALNSEQWDFEDMPQEWKRTGKQQNHTLNLSPDHTPTISMRSFPSSIASGTSTTDFWRCDTETMMTEERTSAILAQYEEEINRTGQ